ncbi:MAG: response regulator [Desulfobacula sp.]|jgi:two-component system chemotaxis sensor kinase CheA
MNDIHKKVFAAFRNEHKNLLASIRRLLATRKPGEAYSRSGIDDLKRCAHTLKGAARAVGLDFVQDAGLHLEKLFSEMDRGTVVMDEEISHIIQTVLDGIETYVADVSDNPLTPSPEHLIHVLGDCLKGNIIEKTLPAEKTKESSEKGLEMSAVQAPSAESNIKKSIFSVFQSECRTHLETIRRIVDTLTTDVSPAREDINTVLRSAHTLKGAARSVDLPVVQQIANGIETLFSDIRDGKKSIGPDVIHMIVTELDRIEDHMISLNQPGSPDIKNPVIKTIRAEEREQIVLQPVVDPEKNEYHEVNYPKDGIETIRIGVDSMNKLQRTADQIMTEGLRQQLVASRLKNLKSSVSGMVKTNQNYCETIYRTLGKIKDQAMAETVFQYFQDQKQFLPKLTAEIREISNQHTLVCRMNADLNRQIQSDILKARMVPAEDVFQFFRKMMRDLAADEGKQIDFKVRGLDVLADRLVLQRLKDPLMHMLRNAISHGIETPEERKAAGKDPAGVIYFSIEVESNRLRITVEDDGDGLDFKAISDLAYKKGYISKDEVNTISPQELFRYIYQPGFTTARMITDLRGRGIGMTVVQEAVNRLRGEIHVKSDEKKGTRFDLLVPLTLSTHRILLVQAGGQTFGIPVQSIDRLIQICRKDIHTVEGNPVINHNGCAIPFRLLSDLLDIGSISVPEENDLIFVVLLHSGHKIIALSADNVLSEAETLIKDLPAPADNNPFFAGGFVNPDGSVSLILNPAVLIEASCRPREGETTFLNKETVPDQKDKATILIVDDSVTTRTLEKTILESQGYKVHLAVDGMNALDLLKTLKIDLVVTDLQMPKMDGFELIEEMKKSEQLKDMPVIIVTSMTKQEDRDRGLNLGADAYIVKQKFDQKNLLEAIGQML